MYFWKVDNLVEDFKAGKVTQLEEFKYMLLFTLLVTVPSYRLFCIESAYNYYDDINAVLCLGITIWGVYYCYKINKEGDNKEFIARVICIGLPAVIRITIFFMPLLILFIVLEVEYFDSAATDELEVHETALWQVVYSVLIITSYYLYLSRKIRAVSS